jgi:tetratricopeptide (TPR) repeat protein
MWWVPQRRYQGAGLYRAVVALWSLCVLLGAPVSAQQPQRPCEITLSIRSVDGSPTEVSANVSLYFFTGGPPINVVQARAGQVVFRNLTPNRYLVEITAGGYQTITQAVDLQIAGQSEQVQVTLTPLALTNTSHISTSSVPVLAPAAQKELTKVLEDLRTNRLADARKRLEKVSRSASGHPDVNYLWGAYCSQVQDRAKAKEYWKKTLDEDPHHPFGLVAMAQVATDEGDLASAIAYLERAVAARPGSWEYNLRLAVAYMAHQELERAEAPALRAIELGKFRAADAHLILARVYAKRMDSQQVLRELEAFVAVAPASRRAPQVRQWIDTLRPPTPTAASSSASMASTSELEIPLISLPPATGNVPLLTTNLVKRPAWMPPDVDETLPSVEPAVACPMAKIEEETGKRVREFIGSVNRITATEYLEDDPVDDRGLSKRKESRRYNYVVTVSRIPTSQLVRVEEYRNGSTSIENFPQHVATLGVPAMALIFDPAFRSDYDMYCEGLSQGKTDSGGRTWQVHFRQRPDQPSRLRGYTLGRLNYGLPLRGRAWITTDSFQVVALETDLVAPLSEIQLSAEHDVIRYAPVKFKKNNQELWLPASAELFLDFHGHQIHRRHSFRDYLLFSVDDIQKISTPTADLEAKPDAPSQ